MVVTHNGHQALERQFHIGQHFHGVGGACRRSDGARRGLGKHQAMRGDDGYHQHRGAVARQPAYAVLVDDQTLVPVQPAPASDHGLGEEIDFLAVQLAAIARDDEGGQLDLGIAQLGNVAQDGVEILALKAFAAYLAKQRRNRLRRLGLGDGHRVAGRRTQAVKRVLRQADLAAVDNVGVAGDVERGQQVAITDAQLQLGQRLKALGAVDLAVPVQVGDVLAVGVYRDTAQGQAGAVLCAVVQFGAGVGGRCLHDCLVAPDISAARTSQGSAHPESRSMAANSAPWRLRTCGADRCRRSGCRCRHSHSPGRPLRCSSSGRRRRRCAC